MTMRWEDSPEHNERREGRETDMGRDPLATILVGFVIAFGLVVFCIVRTVS